MKRRAVLIAATFALVGPTMTGVALSSAEAAAYPIGVYAPKKVNGSQVQGWANLSRDCSGTVGCYNYIKIEKKNWHGASYVGGWWANAHGWNNITTSLPKGCGEYRTTTDSYNEVVGEKGNLGVNLGVVSYTSKGQKVYKFKKTWSSGWVKLCR